MRSKEIVVEDKEILSETDSERLCESIESNQWSKELSLDEFFSILEERHD